MFEAPRLKFVYAEWSAYPFTSGFSSCSRSVHASARERPTSSSTRKKFTPRSSSSTTAWSKIVKCPAPVDKSAYYTGRPTQIMYKLTWQNEILQCFNANNARPRVYQQDVCFLQRSLSVGSPKPQLTIILPLFRRWTV